MVVVGALRAGGSGKTSVVAELARLGLLKGWRVAILAYRLGDGRSGRNGHHNEDDVLTEVHPDSDWKSFSDEALLLRLTGARVFVTRNRRQAWKRLHDPQMAGGEPFDLILSDDGLQDPRLQGAFRILLTESGENPGMADLLPAGPYRQPWKTPVPADMVLVGPSRLNVGPQYVGNEVGNFFPWEPRSGGETIRKQAPEMIFRRTLVFPAGMDRDREWIALCGLGNNGRFLDDLRREGIRLAAVLETRDHTAVPMRRLWTCASCFPGAGWLCTRKDFVKLDPALAGGLDMHVVDQTIALDPRVMEAVEAYRSRFSLLGLARRPSRDKSQPKPRPAPKGAARQVMARRLVS